MSEVSQIEKGKKFFRKVGKLGLEFLKGAIPEQHKAPLEEINQRTVAATIVSYLGNPLLERMGRNKWKNPFSIVDVLGNMGYFEVLAETDFQAKFPAVYKRTRLALTELCNLGALGSRFLPEPDINGEKAYYKVINEDILNKLIKNPERNPLAKNPKI